MVDLLLITGLSGAGKSTTLKVLEDYGYFAIDNLPVSFLKDLTKLLLDSRLPKVALGMDIRSLFDSSTEEFVESINYIKKRKGISVNIVFITAKKEKILQRFRNTKRGHPLMKEGLSLDACIDKEKNVMEKIKEIADYVIDSSELNIKGLRSTLKSSIIKQKSGIKINITSFGYKYGIPLDADLVLDARVLPNPFYIEELKPLTGHDQEIKKYLNSCKQTQELKEQYLTTVEMVTKAYSEQDRAYLNICIGCTGGHHRSVFIAEEIAKSLRNKNYNVKLIDRDIEKEN